MITKQWFFKTFLFQKFPQKENFSHLGSKNYPKMILYLPDIRDFWWETEHGKDLNLLLQEKENGV